MCVAAADDEENTNNDIDEVLKANSKALKGIAGYVDDKFVYDSKVLEALDSDETLIIQHQSGRGGTIIGVVGGENLENKDITEDSVLYGKQEGDVVIRPEWFEKKGFFIGLGVGAHRTKSEVRLENQTQNTKIDWGVSPQIIVGYKSINKPSQSGFVDGWRLYLNYQANLINRQKLVNYHVISVNWEAMVGWRRFGAFVGWGVGAVQYDKSLYGEGSGLGAWNLYLSLNYGLRAVFSKHHSLEFYNNLPITQLMSRAVGTSNIYITQTYQLGLRYIYSF